MEKLDTVSKNKTGSSCGSDHELLIAKFRLKLKKVGKTTRPFRYDLNQIPYDYTVEVRNRFKGLDLIECLMNYGQRFVTLYRRQGSRPSPWKRNAKKQNGCLRRVKLFSHVRLFATPWTVDYQASPFLEFSRREYWSGLPFPSLGDIPDPGIEPRFPAL